MTVRIRRRTFPQYKVSFEDLGQSADYISAMLSADENVQFAYTVTANAVALGVMLAVLALLCRCVARRRRGAKNKIKKEPSERT